MRKNGILFFFLSCFISVVAQENTTPEDQQKDSIAASEVTRVIIPDSLVLQREAIDPLAPSKAAFYSAILPGLGQIYNKKYWKAPIVWGVLGGTIYAYTFNNTQYQRFRTAFIRRQAGFTDDEFFDLRGDNAPGDGPDFDLGDLENQQVRFQEQRDLMLVLVIAAYALNIVEANVNAHLKQFNIDDDLSLDFQPYLDVNPITNNANYGMGLTLKF